MVELQILFPQLACCAVGNRWTKAYLKLRDPSLELIQINLSSTKSLGIANWWISLTNEGNLRVKNIRNGPRLFIDEVLHKSIRRRLSMFWYLQQIGNGIWDPFIPPKVDFNPITNKPTTSIISRLDELSYPWPNRRFCIMSYGLVTSKKHCL